MSNETGRNQFPPSEEEKKFLCGLLYQDTNDSLMNYFAVNFNSISVHSLRTLKMNEWFHAINWLEKKFFSYDYDDFEQFCIKHFHGRTFPEDSLFNLSKIKLIWEEIEGNDDVELVGDKCYTEVTEWIVETNNDMQTEEVSLNEHFSNLLAQEEMKSVYEEYTEIMQRIEKNPNYNIMEVDNESIYISIKDKLSSEFNVENDKEIIYDVCRKYFQLKDISLPTEGELKNLLTSEISTSKNLTLIAYYIQYIVMSLGVTFSKDKTPFGVSKVSGKQTEIMQRLLCAFTTKRWDRLKQKSNTYYKTINNMYKFDKEDEWAKKNLLKQLDSVKRMLEEGHFVEAIRILDEDYEKIKAYK